ncbi:MAG: hypothetical protein ACPGQL_04880 [Thermoplasmatota archaeon]
MALLAVGALLVVLLAPQVPAPTTKDSREIIVQTPGFGTGRDIGCRHAGLTLYDSGASVGTTQQRGAGCTFLVPMETEATLTDPSGAAAPCAYAVLVAWVGGLRVVFYGETNGVEGLQRSGDGSGARPDQYCSIN